MSRRPLLTRRMAVRAIVASVVAAVSMIAAIARAEEPGEFQLGDAPLPQSQTDDKTSSDEEPSEATQTATPAFTPTPRLGIDWSHSPPDPAMFESALTSYAEAIGSDPGVISTVEKRLLDVDGNPFLVLVDESTDAPLLVSDRTPSGDWPWREASLRVLGDKRGLLMGAAGGGSNMGPGDFDRIQAIQTKEFRLSLVYQDMTMVEPNENDFRFETLNWLLKTAHDHDMRVLLHPLIWQSTLPLWLHSKDNAELRRSILDYVRATLGQVTQTGSIGQPIVVVVNEAYGSGDVLLQRLGPGYVDLAFATARESYPSAVLLYNDYDNHTTTRAAFGNNYQKTKVIVDRLRTNGLIDGVGAQMYIEGSDPPPSSEVVAALRSYGLPIYVTEFSVNLRFVDGTARDRLNAQARIYQSMTEACLESAVCRAFADFQLGDRFSVHENLPSLPSYSKIAQPTPYDDNLNPKPALYAQRTALIEGLVPG